MKKYIVIIGAMFALSSCQEDFLDRYPQTSVAPEEFFKTEQDLELYVNGLLSMPGRGSFLDDQSSDNMATTAAKPLLEVGIGVALETSITSWTIMEKQKLLLLTKWFLTMLAWRDITEPISILKWFSVILMFHGMTRL